MERPDGDIVGGGTVRLGRVGPELSGGGWRRVQKGG